MFEVNVSAGGLPEVVERSRWTCLPEVCWRSARGVVNWIVAAPSTLKVGCWRSARGLPEVGRKCTEFESTEDHQRLLPTQEEKQYSHTVG